MKAHFPSPPLLSALALLLFAPSAVHPQSGREIVEEAVQRHEARIAAIDNYTVVQESNGVERTAYYEKRTVDGRPVFVRLDAADLALNRAGVSWIQLQQMMARAFSGAGLQALAGELDGASRDQLARVVASMGQRMAPSSRGDLAAAARDALLEAGTGAVKDALVDAAVDAGLEAVAAGLAGAAGPAVTTVIQALRDAEGFGDALGNLAAALPRIAGGAIPGGQGPPGMQGMNTLPGGIPGGPMGATLPTDPQSLAISAAASAGFGMLVGMGSRAIAGLFQGDEATTSGDPYAVLRSLADEVELVGTETRNGHSVRVLEVRDPGGLVPDDAFVPSALTFSLDTEAHLLREVRMEGEVETKEGPRPMTVRITLEDYREVDGLVHPFRTVTRFGEAGDGVADVDPAEVSAKMDEARRQMERMREQLADLPPEQRRMMEEQLERVGGVSGLQTRMEEQMDALGEGRMETVVQEIRVNAGPPDGSGAD